MTDNVSDPFDSVSVDPWLASLLDAHGHAAGAVVDMAVGRDFATSVHA